MIAIQADEYGIPKVIEIKDGKVVPMDETEWARLLAIAGMFGRAIVPVRAENHDEQLAVLKREIDRRREVSHGLSDV